MERSLLNIIIMSPSFNSFYVLLWKKVLGLVRDIPSSTNSLLQFFLDRIVTRCVCVEFMLFRNVDRRILKLWFFGKVRSGGTFFETLSTKNAHQTLSKLWSFKIRRMALMNYMKLANLLTCRRWNCDIAGRLRWPFSVPICKQTSGHFLFLLVPFLAQWLVGNLLLKERVAQFNLESCDRVLIVLLCISVSLFLLAAPFTFFLILVWFCL